MGKKGNGEERIFLLILIDASSTMVGELSEECVCGISANDDDDDWRDEVRTLRSLRSHFQGQREKKKMTTTTTASAKREMSARMRKRTNEHAILLLSFSKRGRRKRKKLIETKFSLFTPTTSTTVL